MRLSSAILPPRATTDVPSRRGGACDGAHRVHEPDPLLEPGEGERPRGGGHPERPDRRVRRAQAATRPRRDRERRLHLERDAGGLRPAGDQRQQGDADRGRGGGGRRGGVHRLRDRSRGMTAGDRTEAIGGLLIEAEAAHGVYESSVLGGVYDQAWPAWYAAYAVDHGIAELLGHPVTVAELSGFLADAFELYKASDPKPTESWATWMAGRIA